MKMIILIATLAMAMVVSADLIPNGDFSVVDGNFNPIQTVTNQVLDAGWVFNGSSNLHRDETPYLTMGRSEFNNDYRFNMQMWTDSVGYTGNQTVQFDVVGDTYSSGVTGPTVMIQILGANTLDGSSASIIDVDTSGVDSTGSNWTLLLSDSVDVSGGVANDLSTITADFGSGYTYLTIRVGIYASGLDGGFGEDISIDNLEIVSAAVPEPATVGMLGLGALVSVLVRRIRK